MINFDRGKKKKKKKSKGFSFSNADLSNRRVIIRKFRYFFFFSRLFVISYNKDVYKCARLNNVIYSYNNSSFSFLQISQRIGKKNVYQFINFFLNYFPSRKPCVNSTSLAESSRNAL